MTASRAVCGSAALGSFAAFAAQDDEAALLLQPPVHLLAIDLLVRRVAEEVEDVGELHRRPVGVRLVAQRLLVVLAGQRRRAGEEKRVAGALGPLSLLGEARRAGELAFPQHDEVAPVAVEAI